MNNNDSYFDSTGENTYPEQTLNSFTNELSDDRQFPWTPGGPSHGGPFPGGPGGPPHGGPFPGGPGGPSQGGPPFPGGPGGSNQGPGQSAQAPNSPPPNFTPKQSQVQTFAVDSGAIRGCLFRFTYIWLRRDAFWFFPVFVSRFSVAGFRWVGFRWVYFGIDLRQIQSFQCF